MQTFLTQSEGNYTSLFSCLLANFSIFVQGKFCQIDEKLPFMSYSVPSTKQLFSHPKIIVKNSRFSTKQNSDLSRPTHGVAGLVGWEQITLTTFSCYQTKHSGYFGDKRKRIWIQRMMQIRSALNLLGIEPEPRIHC